MRRIIMNKNTGLTEKEWNDVQEVFSAHPQVDRVVLYGSRAMGNFQPASDIDLTLIGNEINLSVLTEIVFELDDLMLPYKFDLTVYEDITNTALKEHIQRVGIVLYDKL